MASVPGALPFCSGGSVVGMKILALAVCIPLFAQAQPRIATVDVTLKQQNRKFWVVTLDNESPLPVQFSRAKVLVRAPSVVQLTRSQASTAVSNGFWATAARVGQEVLNVSPAGLSAAGVATKNQSIGYYGLGASVALWMVQRAQARVQQPNGDELPDIIPLPASGGAEYVLHTSKGAKNQPSVSFQLQVPVP